ncbi:MAG: hypothetical protein GF320_03785, partial [Armatimonadia bacterium]|nr:hypothetical protein [Armatimonadia bacterium]
MDRRRFIQVAGTTAAGATLLSRAEAQAPRRPQPEGEVLRLDATSPHGEPGRRNVYYAFADLAHTIEPGDMLEYDIFVREDSPAHSASVDIGFTEGPYFRESQIQDQDGIPCHPAASLDRRAQGKWHRRRFDLTPLAGRTTGSFELAFANDVATEGTYVVFLDNVRIVRDGQVAADIWSEGPPDPAALVGSQILTDVSLRTVTLDAMDGPPPPLPVAEVGLTAAVPFTTTEDGYAEAPLVAAGRDGFVAATVLRLPSRQDQVAAWTESGQLTPLTAEPGSYDSLCAAGDGEHFAFCWVRNAGDRWTLDTHIDGVTEAIPETGPGRCANPAVDVRGDMGVAVAYEVYHEGGFHVRLVRGAGAGWEAPIDV